MTARYALYFTPRADSAWGRFGEAALIGDARRYGFHATLKAPFRLAADASLEDLRQELDAYCRTLAALPLPALQIARLDDFIALVPESRDPRIDAIAAHCVTAFDAYRASPDAGELARRRSRPLTQRQEAYLRQWGYPYVLDEFRFHLSLTGRLQTGEAPDLVRPPDEALAFDAISILAEPSPGAPFRLVSRHRFGARGRLVYVVGPSGAGKDSVLGWAKRHLRGGAPVVFARRVITRPGGDAGEDHEAMPAAQFESCRLRGEFAMDWNAHGYRYGIRSEIRTWLARGLTVVVNGSREYLPIALSAFPDLEVVLVTAPEHVLHERLAQRNREGADRIAQRVERSRLHGPAPALVAAELQNDGDLDRAGRRFLQLLYAR